MSLTPIFGDGVFPFGAHVYREPHPDLDEVLRDLPILSRLGFNMIKIQESWSTDEPRPGLWGAGIWIDGNPGGR